MIKFHSQLEAVESAIPLARMVKGKTSPLTAHPTGPQVEAKKAMKIQVKTMRTMWPACLLLLSAVPMIAIRKTAIDIPADPMMSNFRRPTRSIVQKEDGVATTLTIYGQY